MPAPAAPQPTPTWRRIEPLLDPTGAPIVQVPPCGGSWLRDADGGLTPRDESTALAAGLIDQPAAAAADADVDGAAAPAAE